MTANTEPSQVETPSTRDYFEQPYRSRAKSSSESLDQVASREIARYIAKKSQRGILVDTGCGTGSFAREASAHFVVAAFDVSKEAVRLVPASINWRWIGAGEAIPLRSGCVDVVTCLDVIEHLPNPGPCISEVHRVLKRGGLLFVRTPNPRSFGLHLKGKNWFGFRDPTHRSIASIHDWKQRFEKSGFIVIDSGTDLLWDPPYFGASENRAEKLFFQGTNMIAMRVKPYISWSRGENTYILARKT